MAAIQAGTQRYTHIKPRALALHAAPKEGAAADRGASGREACAKAFEKGAPASRIVPVQGATHYLFFSHEAEVLKEIRAFAGSLSDQ